MTDLNRRDFMALAAVPVVLQTQTWAQSNRPAGVGNGMFVCMHGASSDRHDFRTQMEGWAKAGIRAAEPSLPRVREWAEKNGGPMAAKKLLDDLGLKAVSSSNQLGLPEPGQGRLKSLEDLKWKVELAQAIGCDRIVAPSAGTGNYTEDDYKLGVDHLREAGEIGKPFGVSIMLEHARSSRFAASLATALQLVRQANHPNVKVMLDTYHFWGGISKFEDLDLLRNGELHHLHFEDVPDTPPREIQGQPHRVFPGEGIAPLRRIVEVLKKKGYNGPASFESFTPAIQAEDPYTVALRVRKAIEPLIA